MRWGAVLSARPEQVMECFLPAAKINTSQFASKNLESKDQGNTHTHTHTQETLNQGLGAEALESGRSVSGSVPLPSEGLLGELLRYFWLPFSICKIEITSTLKSGCYLVAKSIQLLMTV